MKIGVTVASTLLAMSLGFVTVPADASARVDDAVDAPASMGWSTGGEPPPPPIPDWCTPDNPDPACQPPPPPPRHHHWGGFL
jgi:hypothetical protein